jgi:hypothetical protein
LSDIVIPFSESISGSHGIGNYGISADYQHAYAPACGLILRFRPSNGDRGCRCGLILPNSHPRNRWDRLVGIRAEFGSDHVLASLFGASAMQAVVSGQAAVGVAVSAIQLLSAIASVKASASETAAMEERGAETRSAFVFFALSTVFYVFSAGAYAWLMKTPEYQEIKGNHGTRRTSISMSQGFAAGDERASLVSGRSKVATSSPAARAIAMIKTNLPFNFTVAWVFTVTLVRRKNGRNLRLSDIHYSLCSRRSRCLCSRWILQPTASYSAPFTSLSSMLETS